MECENIAIRTQIIRAQNVKYFEEWQEKEKKKQKEKEEKLQA